MAKKIRIHWNKRERRWTAKTSKGCPRFPYILVNGKWNTEVKPHLKANPRGFVLTYENHVEFLDQQKTEMLLNSNPSKERLVYDKFNMAFSHAGGDKILFTPKGAFILSSQATSV